MNIKSFRKLKLFLLLIAIVIVVVWVLFYTLDQSSGAGNDQAIPSVQKPPIKSDSDRSRGSGDAVGQISRAVGEAARMNVPIEFYGKVVDENGNSVSGAVVSGYVVSSFDYLGLPSAGRTKREKFLSGRDGTFSVSGREGSALVFDSISKEGYKMTELDNKLSFSFGAGPSKHKADPTKPISYLLLSSSAEKIRPVYSRTPLSWNEAATEIPVKGSDSMLQILAKRTGFVKDGDRNFDWSVEISMKGGGILKSDGDSLQMAPTEGYSENITFSSSSEGTSRAIARNKAVVFRTASGKFGRAFVTIYADRKEGDIALTVETFFNTGGGRNLE